LTTFSYFKLLITDLTSLITEYYRLSTMAEQDSYGTKRSASNASQDSGHDAKRTRDEGDSPSTQDWNEENSEHSFFETAPSDEETNAGPSGQSDLKGKGRADFLDIIRDEEKQSRNSKYDGVVTRSIGHTIKVFDSFRVSL
jgi:hypothetical protein